MAIPISEKLNDVLNQIEINVPGVEATAVFDMDGLVIASRLPMDVDDEIIGAMSAALLSIGSRSGQDLNRGSMQRILVEGDNGSIIIMKVGESVVLVALVRKDVKLGMLFWEFKRAISRIMDYL